MRKLTAFIAWFVTISVAIAADPPAPRPDPLDPSYQHDRWHTVPRDQVREYRAYITSFDGPDDNDGDGVGDLWGIPEWVSYEMHAAPSHAAYESRPNPWLVDTDLYHQGIAPRDQSYVSSGYSRGHMCMREHGRRLGKDADWNTHNTLNACPQDQSFNAGIWLGLEKKCGNWANVYGRVWVICGPIVLNSQGKHTPSAWIGDGNEKRVAVPDRFFKIVVKESVNPERPDVLAFIYPHNAALSSSAAGVDHRPYLVSVREVERETGLKFFTTLAPADRDAIEASPAINLWPETAPHGPLAMGLLAEKSLELPAGEVSASTCAPQKFTYAERCRGCRRFHLFFRRR